MLLHGKSIPLNLSFNTKFKFLVFRYFNFFSVFIKAIYYNQTLNFVVKTYKTVIHTQTIELSYKHFKLFTFRDMI